LLFRVYLFYLPVRIVYYGSAFIALGKSKAILYRSVVSLVLTAIFCYLLTNWIGFTGAAISTVMVSYIWAVPYNLITLSKEFGCNPLEIIPFKKLEIILVLSIIAGIVSAIVLVLISSPLIEILLGFLIFGIIYAITTFHYLPEFKEIIAPAFKIFNKYHK